MAGIECPFCGFKSRGGEQVMQFHIEQLHTEDSPFVPRHNIRAPSRHSDPPLSEESMPADNWTKCTRPGCGSYVLLSDVDEHLNLHEAEALTGKGVEEDDETKSGAASPKVRRRRRRRSSHSQSQSQSQSSTTPVSGNSPRKQQKLKAPDKAPSRGTLTILNYFSGASSMGRPPRQPPHRRELSEPREPGRLGQRELGLHAFEDVMPARVRQSLLHDALPQHIQRIGPDTRMYRYAFVPNETKGLVPILADLCALDPDTEASYFCDPNVKHVVHLRCDGNFCGYWNIQMMLSHIRCRAYPDREELQHVPNVLQIQDTIEQAWDNGICAYGRIETGGVRGTRKWIGTHETVAYFTQLGVRVEALAFKEEQVDGRPQHAVVSLLDHVEAYYMSGLENARQHHTSSITFMAPIYFQRLGHSMTIVGIERKKDGSRNLLVFDPSFSTSDAVRSLLAGRISHASPQYMLRAYRRSETQLTGWDEFEIVVPQPWQADDT